MTDTESQAHELVRRKEWQRAVELYDKVLSSSSVTLNNKTNSKERIVACLLGRSECCLELGRHEAVVADCRKIIKLLADGNENNNGARARKRLVYALFSLRRFSEAEVATREWLLSGSGAQNHPEALKTLERLRSILQMASGQKGGNVPMLQKKLDEELVALESRFEALTGNKEIQQQRKNRKHSSDMIDDKKKLNKNEIKVQDVTNGIACSYCRLTFSDRNELRAHCQSESHQTVIMSDEGRDWKWRPPPRGFKADTTYTLCESIVEGGMCRYGAQCVEAHSADELAEWRERFEYRRMRLQRACEKELYGKSYTEQILEKWIQSATPDKVLREKVDGIDDTCSADLATTVSSKSSKREWTFTLKTKKQLKAVALLQDAHRNHFFLKQISLGTISQQSKKNNKNKSFLDVELTSDQEWCNQFQQQNDPHLDNSSIIEHKVKVQFCTDIFGTFRQSVVFDFGLEPVLVKHLCVDVIPVTDADKVKEIRKEIILSAAERWDINNSDIVVFTSPVNPQIGTIGLSSSVAEERDLLNLYPAPTVDTFQLTHSTIVEKKLTKNNYRSRMHELLCVEEMARYEQVARYNLTTKLRITQSYLLAPNGIATSTAKYSHSGELFALLSLGKDVSEDTSAGRLILNNCTSVLLTAATKKLAEDKKNSVRKKIYEALIEDKGKNVVYLRLSAQTVKDFNLKTDTDFLAEIQFQLNRISYCEWHYAIDKIADFRVIFPDINLEPNIPWTPQRQWSNILDSRLNLKQREAVVAITTPVTCPLPPILIIGPFGTGKTYTLAQAIKQLLLQPETKILICTHSNSAADLYIKDYLHPYVEAGHEEAKPLRIYYHKRWVATVNQVVQKYCLIETAGGVRSFRIPTLEDIMKHRIIVVTLSISMYLSTMGLPKGYFTHILLDEAAQAMECEAIMPLALANEHTRIVLAGDHMQLSPELFSKFAKERNLHVSLLERLYDHYPTTFPCKILLCENYRAHEAIIQFTSELFYDQKLISSGKQPRHDKFYPLTFFTTRGEDVQDQNSTAFYNNSEVYEVVERVCELRKRWPTSWGKMDEQSIGIMTPYADQVFRIRSELRKRRMGGISVERVLNVQGKQFRAIFLSTVRTRRTCTGIKSSGDDMDYGFLSNSKLLNTAITRAQSLVAVVGDPVALCSIGRCRKVWERFIDICNQNKSLFGITWSYLRSQLDGVELKKTYVLNPLAPEFIPRQFQTETYIKMPVFNASVPPPNIQGTTANNNQAIVPQSNYILTSNVTVPGSINTSVGTLPFVLPGAPPPGAPPMISMPSWFLPIPNNQTHFRSLPPPPASVSSQQPPALPPQAAQPPLNIQAPPTQFPNANNTSLNPWNSNVNYSLISPSTGRNTPNNWQQTKLLPPSVIKKPNILNTLYLNNIRPPTNLSIPLRSPITDTSVPPPPSVSQPHFNTNNILKNNGLYIPLISQRIPGREIFETGNLLPESEARLTNSITGSSNSILGTSNSIIGTNALINSINQNIPQQQPLQPPLSSTVPQTKVVEPQFPNPLKKSSQEKEQIQFLNNVHFPERQSNQLQNCTQQIPNSNNTINDNALSQPFYLQNQQSIDINSLLPINMTLTDMLLQPPSQHVEWYRHLIDVSGIDTANKFMEFLIQAKKQHDMILQVNLAKSIDELLNDKTLYNSALNNSTANQIIPNLPPSQQLISNNSNWSLLDRTTEQLQSQQLIPNNFQNNKPLLLRDLETSLLTMNSVQQFDNEFRNDLQQPSQQITSQLLPPPPPPLQLPPVITNRIPDTIRLPWEQPCAANATPSVQSQQQPTPQQQSVPLYRRQSQLIQQPTPSEINSDKLQHHTLVTNAFAGYARASMNSIQQNQTNTSNYVQQQQQQQQQQQLLNQQRMQQQSYFNSIQEQQFQRQVNADFANMSLRNDTMEEMLQRQQQQNQQETTYASVLRQSNNNTNTSSTKNSIDDHKTNSGAVSVGDPFAVLRELEHKATTATNGGLYKYFS